MATIKGDRQELKPGFYAITRDAEGGKLLAFFNETIDTQFNVCYTLQDPQVRALGRTQVADGTKFAVSVYPGETVEFVQGTWKGFKRALSFGAPDKAWQEQNAQKLNAQVEAEILSLKELIKKYPKADGKYTAEYIAELCVQHKHKFIDLTFAPKSTSLARDWEPPLSEMNLTWLRPEQYLPADKPAALFVGDIEPNDIDQGILGDCYLLCALSCVAEFPLLVRDAFSSPQNPELGIYRILVCKNGWWQTVIVDDFLPTQRNNPCFARNKHEPNELWVSLFEKAYAKLHGSYAAIRSGDSALAVADILGAPYRKMKQLPEWNDKGALFRTLKQADDDDNLMALGTPGKAAFNTADSEKDALTKEYELVGLATGHAYSLLRVKNPQGLELCMIRNPWGDGKEWNGAWSDDSPLWTPELQKAVGFYKGDDGTFWMCWQDVCKYFDNGSISIVMREWSQLRVTGNIVSGVPDVVLQLQVTKPVQCWFGYHQRDTRGLPTGDKDTKYAALLISVLSEPPETPLCEKIAESYNGAYSDVRDGFAACELQPKPHPYYVIIQAFDATVTKSFTMSAFFSDPSAVSSAAFFTRASDAAGGRYVPATKFRSIHFAQRAAANYQIRTTAQSKEGMQVQQLSGETVDLSVLRGATAPVAARHADPTAIAPQRPPAAVAAAKAPAPKPAAPAAAAASPAPAATGAAAGAIAAPVASGKARKSGIKLQVIVIAGRNLVAKDDNGKSDPYVVLKLKTPQGVLLDQENKGSTRYIQETLDPCWCEVFNFLVEQNDVLLIECFDKDTFGEEIMGTMSLALSTVLKTITAGGPSRIDWFPLTAPPDDASGELQLAFTWNL